MWKVTHTLVCICAFQFSVKWSNDGSQVRSETFFAQVDGYGSQKLKNARSLRKMKSVSFFWTLSPPITEPIILTKCGLKEEDPKKSTLKPKMCTWTSRYAFILIFPSQFILSCCYKNVHSTPGFIHKSRDTEIRLVFQFLYSNATAYKSTTESKRLGKPNKQDSGWIQDI